MEATEGQQGGENVALSPEKEEQIDATLKELSGMGESSGSILLTRTGLLLFSQVRGDVETDHLAQAISTSVINMESGGKQLRKEPLSHIIARIDDINLIVHSVMDDIYLSVITLPDANLGILLIETRKQARKIAQILSK